MSYQNNTMSSICLSVSHLSVLHLQDVYLELHRGECIGLSGPSGCGKSLLLRALADLQEHSGEVLLHQQQQSLYKPAEWRKQVALLPAESQWWCDTVGEHFSTVDDELLAELGFDRQVMNWQVSRMSSGEKQRLAIARLLQNQPTVLLLDEPTANLDETNSYLVEGILKRYLEGIDACAIVVSHDLAQLSRVATRRFHIDAGRMEAA